MRKLTVEERNAVRECLEGCRDIIEDVRTSYSGRGMYGETCFGVVTEDPMQLVGSLSMNLGMSGYDDLAIDFYSNACMDSMGLSRIIYFPEIQWDGEEFDDLDEFFEFEEDEEDEE